MKSLSFALAAGPIALAAGLSGVSATSADAQTISCGASYTVVGGDTLGGIANRAYDDPLAWRLIYSINRDVIGANPGLIEIGQVIEIPCQDGQAATPVASTASVGREETTEALPPPVLGGMRILTGTGWAPFSDEDQPQGGMMTEVVNTALLNVLTEDDYQIDFINDWGAHLQPLLTDNAYDFSFPWFRPNCDVLERLGDDSQFRCNNFDWSEPIYEQIIGYYTLTDYPTPLSHADFMGKRVCRPAGWSQFMLEEHNLVEPRITMVAPAGPEDCFDLLLSGDVDVLVLATDVADGMVTEREALSLITRHDALDSIATLHLVTSKNNPRGAEYLSVINQGINELKNSGEWFGIVRRHLAEFRMAS